MQGRSGTAGALPHCCATHLPEDGYDIRTLPQSLGHSDLQTAMVYTHVTTRGAGGVRNPLDRAACEAAASSPRGDG
jgi:site-specific recombinase XerD